MEASPASTGSSKKRPRNDNCNNTNNITAGRGGRGGGRRSNHQNGRGGRHYRPKNNDHVASSRARATAVNNDRNKNHAQRAQQQQQQQDYSSSHQRSNNRSSRLEENDNASATKTLPWPNPHTHYVPLHEEERLLPSLLHWGKSERGMMKDQPPFRLQKIQKLLLLNHNGTTRDTLARDSGEGCSGEERWVLNRLGGMAIVRVRSRRKEHGRTDGSSVLYTLQDTYCVRSTRCWFVETMRVSAPEHYWRAVEKDDTAANPC